MYGKLTALTSEFGVSEDLSLSAASALPGRGLGRDHVDKPLGVDGCQPRLHFDNGGEALLKPFKGGIIKWSR